MPPTTGANTELRQPSARKRTVPKRADELDSAAKRARLTKENKSTGGNVEPATPMTALVDVQEAGEQPWQGSSEASPVIDVDIGDGLESDFGGDDDVGDDDADDEDAADPVGTNDGNTKNVTVDISELKIMTLDKIRRTYLQQMS